MDYFLAGATSLKALRIARSPMGHALLGDFLWQPGPCEEAPCRRDLEALRSLLPYELAHTAPLDLTYFERCRRPSTSLINAHSLLCDLPPMSFIELLPASGNKSSPAGESRVFIESAGLAFIRMAQSQRRSIAEEKATEALAIAELATFGAELCGSYALNARNPLLGPYSRGIAPLCTAQELVRYVDEIGGVRGVRLARIAAPLVSNSSSSPPETLLALALGLPARLGGAGLPEFCQNQPLDLGGHHKGLVRSPSLQPSFFWPRHKVAIEYRAKSCLDERDEEEGHLRRQDYAALGIDLLEARPSDIKDLARLERFVRLLALKLAPSEDAGFMRRVESGLARPEAREKRSQLISRLGPARRELDYDQPRDEDAVAKIGSARAA